MSKSDKEQSFLDVEGKVDGIIKKFVKLCSTIFDSLQSRNIEVSTVQTFFQEYLNQLLADYHNMKEIIAEVLKATSIVEVQAAVMSYYSFFNSEIIEDLIEKHGSDQDKSHLKEYIEDFSKFIITVHKSGVRCGPRIPGKKMVTFKLDECDKKKLPGRIFKQVRRNISRILEIREVDLTFVKIRNGCLNFDFLVSESVYQHIKLLQLREEDRIMLFKESITSVQTYSSSDEVHII